MTTLTNKITYRGLAVWAVCAIFYMYEFMLRTVLGTFQSSLMTKLHLSTVTFALLSSTAYQLVYGLMQVPVGIITERFSLKKALFAAVLICVVANAGFALATSFWAALLCRILMGLGSSFGFVCLLVTIYDWMPRKNIALFIGLSQFIGTLGPMAAGGPLNYLANNSAVSYGLIFGCLAGIGLIIATLVLIVVDKNKQDIDKQIILVRHTNIIHTLMQLIRQKQIWYIAIFSGCIYFGLGYFSENECKSFLVSKGFSLGFSAYMITLAWLGYAVGCTILGFVSDRIHRRKSIMFYSAVMALVGMTGIVYLPLGEYSTSLCFVFLGAGASGQSIAFAIMAEQCKESYIAVGFGFNNAMISLCSGIIAPFIGFILSLITQASPLTTLANYQRSFLIIIGLLILATILSRFFIEETFCRSTRENVQLIRPQRSQI